MPERKRRVLTVVFESEHHVLVSGHGSRELLTRIKGRPPIWSVTSSAWAVNARTARDAVALAEVRGFDVVVEHAPAPVPAVSPGEHPDPGQGLW